MTPSANVPATDQFDVRLPANPYPGLRPFEKDEWPIFFGREKAADEVIGRLLRAQFLVVHGDSGCGKSSLLQAGVLARLEQDSARSGLTWRTCAMQPRDTPLRRLAAALAALDGGQGDQRSLEIRRILNFGADAPLALARLLRRGETDHICILVDQFEELFAHAKRHGPDEARLLVQLLISLLEQPPPGLYAVLTMRSEFLGACAHFPGFPEAVNRAQYLLPRMVHADMLRAIREPATLYGGQVEPGLAARLIGDAGGRQDELPLIQHGLMVLYRRRRPTPSAAASNTDQPGIDDPASVADAAPGPAWRLELGDYGASGGLSQLLAQHADDLCPEDDARLRIVESLFRALTDINAEGQATRRPQRMSRLTAVAGTDLSTLNSIIQPFRDEGASFLTPLGGEPLDETALLDIGHEALIRCWRKLSDPKDGWLVREFQDGLVWRALLVQADSFDRNPSNILSPATAEERESWLAGHNAAWAERYGGGWDRVQKLVLASVAAGQTAAAEKIERAKREIAQLTEINRKQRLTWALVCTGLVVFLLGAFAAWKWRQAGVESERMVQDVRQFLKSIDDPELEARLANLIVPAEQRQLTSTEESRLAEERSTRTSEQAQARSPAQYGLKLWENGVTLRVRFLGGTEPQHVRVALIARQWTRYANLRFQFVPTGDSEIRVALVPSDGSWSFVGSDALGIPQDEPTMNLAFDNLEGAVLHEFGHVLGLLHENANPNAHLPWNKEKVYQVEGGPPNNWTRLTIDYNILQTASKSIEYREFDADSIMLYAYPGSWFTDGVARGGKQVLSESDKRFARKLYPTLPFLE